MGTFSATVPGVVKANAAGVWATSTGSLAPVAGVGELAPGCLKAHFGAFTQLALPDQGGVILVATLTGAGVTPANNDGVWAVNTAGKLRLIVRKGGTIPVDNVPEVISTLSALTSTPVTMAQPGGFNSQGNLIYQTSFKDRSQGIFTAIFPSTPTGP